MEDIYYNILWIDDEHEKLSSTKGRAKRFNINLIPFKALNSGMDELERNYSAYDGVLFDAKFFENEDDLEKTEDTKHVHRAKERLLHLNKKFEVFIFTGQNETYSDQTFKNAFPKIYRKGNDDDTKRLFEDLKKSCQNREDTQIRRKYKRVFDVCTDKYIGTTAEQDILNLLKINDEISDIGHFNSIRKIVEDLFRAFNEKKLLPSEFVTPNIALNPSALFLSGQRQHKHTNKTFKQNKHLEGTHLPQPIANLLKYILSVTQDGSHRSNVDKHVKNIKTPYLFKSTLFQLLDVLIWFKMHVDSKPKENNWE